MNEKVLLNIKKDVPTTIFELPKIKMRVTSLFDDMDDNIKSRFNEIKNFIMAKGHDENYSKISYDDIITLFRLNLYSSIFNEAIEATLTRNEEYDIVESILKLLSKDRLEEAILGKEMIDAFNRAIKNLPCEDAFDKCLHGSTMLLLAKEFLKYKYNY